jgi:tRNA pseudouridine55 synthase
MLGATTPSYDMETEVNESYPTEHITARMIEKARKDFLGEISQIPPSFSAVKVDGERAYKLARKEQEVKMQARQVVINLFEIVSMDIPEISIKVNCSKGTYIRTLADDFGKSLQSGAYLSGLRRTKIGNFSIKDALNINQLEYLIRSVAQQNI